MLNSTELHFSEVTSFKIGTLVQQKLLNALERRLTAKLIKNIISHQKMTPVWSVA